MKLKIFTVYDSKMEAYMMPFFLQTRGAAIRAWMDSVNDLNTQFNKHPGDFTLFEIGEYDDETGNVSNYDAKVSIGTALEYKNKTDLQQLED